MKTIYEELSEERKQLQEQGLLPDWFSTSSWQLFSTKYLTKTERDFKSVARRISKCAAKWTDDPDYWEEKFFTVIWNGWLSCATPVLANMGTNRGCPVSCFIAGTMVNTIDGQKPIEELIIGDLVLTHDNSYQPILDTMSRESDDIYELEFMGEVFFVTGNHLILTKEHDWVRVDELDPEVHEIVQIKDRFCE